MSRSGRSDEVGVLRDAIAHIESDGRGAAPSFATPQRGHRTIALGQDTALDQALKGGLARGALHEIVAATPGDAPAACGFALALAARFAATLDPAAPIVWILEDHAKAESGAPYAPGLAAHGLDPARLVIVHTASGADSLWAMEEALKCKTVAAVVGEVWRLKPYDLAASRRLVLTAQKSGTPGLMLPAGAAGQACNLSSAARTRFEVRAMAGPHAASAGGRTPLPGLAAWAVRIARIRAGPGGFTLDQDRFWPVLWDHEEACFRDALPLPVSTPARDRPRRPAARVQGATEPRDAVARSA